MLDKIFGIMRRAYYLVAALITLTGVIWLTTEGYSYYKEPKLQSWRFVNLVPNRDLAGYYRNLSNPADLEGLLADKNVVRLELVSNAEIVTVEISGKFSSMTKAEQDREVEEIAKNLWLTKNREWLSLFLTIFLTFPVAIIIHRVAHWIVWGKIK